MTHFQAKNNTKCNEQQELKLNENEDQNKKKLAPICLYCCLQKVYCKRKCQLANYHCIWADRSINLVPKCCHLDCSWSKFRAPAHAQI